MKIGIIMDPIELINIKKDSSFAMLLAAQSRSWDVYYMTIADLFLREDSTYASMQRIKVADDPAHWFDLEEPVTCLLSSLDIVLMRKDPPVDMQYIYTSYLLENARNHGTLVINNPVSLRDVNEKLFVINFPQCIAPTLVTNNKNRIISFLSEQEDIVIKPLNAMGGRSVFRIQAGDKNSNVIIETLTHHNTEFCMTQKYIPEIVNGDKRILLINGEPIEFALARLPDENDHRANLVAGGTAVQIPLSERDKWICEQIKPVLIEKGLIFTGIDIIGDFLTEINVTSPTCIRELDDLCNMDIAGQLMDEIETMAKKR